jgi:hypothetical protein
MYIHTLASDWIPYYDARQLRLQPPIGLIHTRYTAHWKKLNNVQGYIKRCLAIF